MINFQKLTNYKKSIQDFYIAFFAIDENANENMEILEIYLHDILEPISKEVSRIEMLIEKNWTDDHEKLLKHNPYYKVKTIEKLLQNSLKNMGIKENSNELMQVLQAITNEEKAIHIKSSNTISIGREIFNNLKKQPYKENCNSTQALMCLTYHSSPLKNNSNTSIMNEFRL